MTRILVALVVVALCASCSGGDDDDGDDAATATPGSAGNVEAVQLPSHGEALEPGWYFHEPFTPPLVVRVEEGWTGGHLNPEFWDVQRPDVILAFAHPEFMVDESGQQVSVAGMSATEALEVLTANAQLNAAELEEGEVDERAAVVLELRPETSAAVLGGPSGQLTLEGSKPARVIALDVDGALLLVLFLSLDGTTDGYGAAQVALETVVIG